MQKVRKVTLFENKNILLVELFNYPKIRSPLMAMKALEQIERVKKKLTKKYMTVEVFKSTQGAFKQIVKIEKYH